MVVITKRQLKKCKFIKNINDKIAYILTRNLGLDKYFEIKDKIIWVKDKNKYNVNLRGLI